MIYINALVVVCYALCGIALLAAYLFGSGSGNLVALSVICGWFLVVYSVGAYALMAVLSFLRRSQNLWATLYPVNFSLALGAILLLGIRGPEIIVPLLVFIVLGASVGLFIRRTSLANMRALPLIPLVPLLLCILPIIGQYWALVFSLVAAFLLMSYVDARLFRRRDR